MTSPALADMTPGKLKVEIAERLGFDLSTLQQETPLDFSALRHGKRQDIPDWPHEAGEALALCLEIAEPRAWRVMIDPENDIVYFMEQEIVYDTHVVFAPVMDAQADDTAFALSRLALSALRDDHAR